MLFLGGERCAGLYLVQRGALRLFTGHAGKEQTLRVVLAGETCNEVAACGGGANPTSAQAIDDSDVLVLSPTDVAYLLGRSDAFAHTLLATVADRARHFVALVGDLSFRHVTGRVAKVLLPSVAPGPGVGAGTGGRSLTQQELADLVSTAREVVARSLRTLCATGALAMARGRIVIRDRHLLEEAAAESCPVMTSRTPPRTEPLRTFDPRSPVGGSAPPALAASTPRPGCASVYYLRR